MEVNDKGYKITPPQRGLEEMGGSQVQKKAKGQKKNENTEEI